MSNYTPNTEAVREQYTREQPPHIGTVGSKSAEFNRWLNQVKAEVWREGNMAGRYEITEPADVPNPYEDEA